MLIGNPIIPIPEHPQIHHLGFVNDQDKFDALAAAELLIMPSYFESLSMVALEAWALGKPVLANGRCDVLKGQCIRSNGGLYYESFPRVHRDAARDRLHARRWRRRSAATAASYFKQSLHLADHRAQVSRHARAAAREPARRGMEPLPAGGGAAATAAETVVAGRRMARAARRRGRR